jgi:hypothetical protein
MGLHSKQIQLQGLTATDLNGLSLIIFSVSSAISTPLCRQFGFGPSAGTSSVMIARPSDEYLWSNGALVRVRDGDLIVATVLCGAALDVENGFPLPNGSKRSSTTASSLSGALVWQAANTHIRSVTVNFTRPFIFTPSIVVRPLNYTGPITSKVTNNNKGFVLSINTSVAVTFLVEWVAREAGVCVCVSVCVFGHVVTSKNCARVCVTACDRSDLC